MNYLQMKKKAMLNYVSGSQPSVNIQVVTHQTSEPPSIDITVDGITTNWVNSTIRNKIISTDYYNITYGNYSGVGSFQIWFKGNFDVNGTPYTPYDVLPLRYDRFFDYDCIGQKVLVPQNTIRITSTDRQSFSAGLTIADEDDYTLIDWNKGSYNKAIGLYYSSQLWTAKANQDVEYNGVTYHNGETITQWNYQTDVDIDITIL